MGSRMETITIFAITADLLQAGLFLLGCLSGSLVGFLLAEAV